MRTEDGGSGAICGFVAKMEKLRRLDVGICELKLWHRRCGCSVLSVVLTGSVPTPTASRAAGSCGRTSPK